MLLENRTALIYGSGGAIGSTVAHAFAREGTKLFLAGRTLAKVEAVANAATLMASDYASAMTEVIANVTCGCMVD